jgi:hypothetical protein
MERGRMFVLEDVDVNEDGVINIDDLQWSYLEGDGDFRSKEVIALRGEADIVITNPPFSLFREFVTWLVDGGIKFSVIGSGNAPTTKEIFPLVKDNRLWKGATANNTDMVFGVPKGTEINEADKAKAERLGYPSDSDYDYTRLGNSCWFTNIDHGRRHEPLQLMTMADNIKFSRHMDVRGAEYQKYDNFDAIAIPYTDAIPSDYDGVMGVPFSYLDKYNPEQFEIVGITKTWFGAASKIYPQQIQVSASGQRTKVGKLNDGAVLKVEKPIDGKTYYEVNGENFIQTYPRVLIRKKVTS